MRLLKLDMDPSAYLMHEGFAMLAGDVSSTAGSQHAAAPRRASGGADQVLLLCVRCCRMAQHGSGAAPRLFDSQGSKTTKSLSVAQRQPIQLTK